MSGFPLDLGDTTYSEKSLQGKNYLVGYPSLLDAMSHSLSDKTVGYVRTKSFIPRPRLMRFSCPKHRLWPQGQRLYFLKVPTDFNSILSAFTVTVLSYDPTTGLMEAMVDAVAAYDGVVSAGDFWKVGPCPVTYYEANALLGVTAGGYGASFVESPMVARSNLMMGNPKDTIEVFEDFDRPLDLLSSGWHVEYSGGIDFTGPSLADYADCWGVMAFNTAAVNTYACIYRPGSFRLSAEYTAVTRIYIPTLSDGSDRFRLQVGLTSNGSTRTSDLFSNSGIGFEYDLATLSTTWYRTVNNASSPTRTSTGITVATGWNDLKVVVSGTTATFYVNGVSGGSHNTNVPIANTNSGLLGDAILMRKTLGSTARNVVADYVWRTSINQNR